MTSYLVKVNAFFRNSDTPLSLRQRMSLALPLLRHRGLFFYVLLGAFILVNGLPLVAQDAGGASAGSLNFQKAPVNGILDLYERLSGKHLIRDTNLDGTPPVTMNATGLSKDETLKLIESTLLLNGVAIVQIDEHNVKVVTVGQNKNPRSEGVKLYANAADLPTDEQIVSYYMPLSYINPQEAVGIFSQVTAPPHPYGGYVPAPSAQAVVLTENVSIIRQLIALKELVDVPPAKVASEWVQLNRADAEKVADILNKMLNIGPNGVSTVPPGPGGVVNVPPDLGTKEPLSNEKNLISGSAQILPDPRSNRILVITRPVNIPFLEQMIGQLDQPDIFMVPQRRPLKYVLAQDILPALEAALAQGKDEQDEVKKDAQSAQSKTPNQPNGGGGASTPSSSPGGSSGGTGTVSAITPQLSAPAENNVPTVVTVGKTRLLADNRSNSIIVFGSPDIVTRVFNMVDELDRRPLQVYLATVIGQLSVKEGFEFGIDILQKYQHGVSSSNINTTTGTGSTSLIEPSSLTKSTGFPIVSGLNVYAAVGNTLNAYVKALETTNRFKVIERPSVFTTNNKLAVIASGSQVPVPSSTTQGFAGTSSNLTTTSSIAYEDVLLQLDIIPLINANHDVTLQIRQTNNSLGNNVVISGNSVPTILTQEINTEVTVPDKSTVVIGGLISDTTKRDTGGVPFLSDIPILGYLFKDTEKSKDREELIIMIQPTVIETDADQIAANETEKQRTILGQEAVQAATGEAGTLPQNSTLLVPSVDTKTKTTTSTSNYNSKTGTSTKTTTTTTTTPTVTPLIPAGKSSSTSLVPALSTPAPDVSNGRLPNYPVPPSTSPSSSH